MAKNTGRGSRASKRTVGTTGKFPKMKSGGLRRKRKPFARTRSSDGRFPI
jgi:hypothetical protein